MTITEKATYLRIALALQKITVHQSIAEQIVDTLDAIKKKGGDFSINDAVDIELKHEEIRKKESNP